MAVSGRANTTRVQTRAVREEMFPAPPATVHTQVPPLPHTHRHTKNTQQHTTTTTRKHACILASYPLPSSSKSNPNYFMKDSARRAQDGDSYRQKVMHTLHHYDAWNTVTVMVKVTWGTHVPVLPGTQCVLVSVDDIIFVRMCLEIGYWSHSHTWTTHSTGNKLVHASYSTVKRHPGDFAKCDIIWLYVW